MIGYVKYFNDNKTMHFGATDNKIFKKYIKIWERVSNLMNIEFESEAVDGDNDKYIKTDIKLYGDKVNTNFIEYLKKILLIMLDSVIMVNRKYYP